MTTPSQSSVREDDDGEFYVGGEWIECYLCGGEGTYECENWLECCDGEHACQHCGGRGGFDGEASS